MTLASYAFIQLNSIFKLSMFFEKRRNFLFYKAKIEFQHENNQVYFNAELSLELMMITKAQPQIININRHILLKLKCINSKPEINRSNSN